MLQYKVYYNYKGNNHRFLPIGLSYFFFWMIILWVWNNWNINPISSHMGLHMHTHKKGDTELRLIPTAGPATWCMQMSPLACYFTNFLSSNQKWIENLYSKVMGCCYVTISFLLLFLYIISIIIPFLILNEAKSCSINLKSITMCKKM